MPIATIRDFLKYEAAGGILLIIAAALALFVANSILSGFYSRFIDIPVAIQFGRLEIAKPLLLWINDGLMAVFFFLIGLEVKREFLVGELSSPSKVALPALGAIGGIVFPAAIYVALNWGGGENLNGWAIPAATDIAFALGVLALLGSRAPIALKVLLTAIAIFDDIGAIVIIAIFYTSELSFDALYVALGFLAVLLVINRIGISRTAPYVLLGIALWVCVLKSGVHATLAGFVTALFVPMVQRKGRDDTLLGHLEHGLHPWVAFAVLPLFAFANAGVSFEGVGLASFTEPVKLGISLGLFLGKQIGCFVMIWLAIRVGIARMPDGSNWLQLYGVSMLCGVGFTMSLFIGGLAFEHSDFDAPIRLGVLTGSLLSAVGGYLLLLTGSFGPAKQPAPEVQGDNLAEEVSEPSASDGPSASVDSPSGEAR
jgi:NhaA family Na+:H+ antiporter